MYTIDEEPQHPILENRNFVSILGDFDTLIATSLEKLKTEDIVPRIWQHDYSVWKTEPTEITNRLGWLHSPDIMRDALSEIQEFVDDIKAEGFTDALLLGMGGSSLAPEVFRFIFGVQKGFLNVQVLDSTIPGVVLDLERKLDFEKTLFIVSTKSGGTVETLSFMKYFYNQVFKKVGQKKIGRHFIAITDPGSGLEAKARELGFRKTFLNDPNIGGRYSALSYFGLVPAGLIGVDLKQLLDRAQKMACYTQEDPSSVNGDNTAAQLGTVMGELAQKGRDKITFIMSPTIESFGSWVEQLIAESTGKEGVGILPVVGETIFAPCDYADDRQFVYLKINNDSTYDNKVQSLWEYGHPVIQIDIPDFYDLGSEFFRWEMATAIAGYFLKINPFDQPNVESAKVQARKMVTVYQEEGKLPDLEPSFTTDISSIFTEGKVNSLDDALQKFLSWIDREQTDKNRAYVAIQAFIQPTGEVNKTLQEFRTRIQNRYHVATTLGYGPRFLHSTGQLHKGDGGNGLFIQITTNHPDDVSIPDSAGKVTSSITFGVLASAQALGDRKALIDANRKVIRFHLKRDIIEGVSSLTEAIQ
jgi:glucose-6-phosphate isomerase